MLLINKITNNIYFIFFLLLIFVVEIPIINFVNLSYFFIIILIFFCINERKKEVSFSFILILILLSIFANKYLNNNFIKESHGIFLPNDQNIDLYLEENNEVFLYLIKEFQSSYSDNDLTCKQRYQDAKCWKDIKIENVYSRSFDNIIFKKINYSRKVNSINYKNFSEVRVGSINSLRYNWFTDPETWYKKEEGSQIKRIHPPYIIKYEFINTAFEKSQFCFKGKALLFDNQSKDFDTFNNKEKNCLFVKNNQELIFYNFNNELSVFLEKSIDLIAQEYFLNFINLFIILLILYLSIGSVNLIKISEVLFICFLSSIIIFYNIYFKNEFSFGYAPLQGGMDGMAHEGYGRHIYESFLNLNFYEVFRGGESIFWFMPGLRYFSALNKFFFGDTQFGTYLLLVLLPILFYYFLLYFFSRKVCLIIITIFILLKIPHLGFSFNHYVVNLLTMYSETMAIIMFLISIICMINKKYFMLAFFASLMVFLRPNYLPVYVLMNVYNFFILIEKKEIKNLLFLCLGATFLLIMPLHNYFFGDGALVLFVNIDNELTFLPNNRKEIYLYEYISLFYSFDNFNKIFEHFLNFLTIGMKNEIVYIINSILLFNLLVYVLINLYNIKNFNVFFCYLAIIQITPSLFHSNTGRFVYFTWFLITVANLLIFKRYIILIRNWWV